jgi:hypothetical protein
MSPQSGQSLAGRKIFEVFNTADYKKTDNIQPPSRSYYKDYLELMDRLIADRSKRPALAV